MKVDRKMTRLAHLRVMHFCWSIAREFPLTLISFSSLALFETRSNLAASASVIFWSSRRMVSLMIPTSSTRRRCGGSLQASISGLWLRFFSLVWATCKERFDRFDKNICFIFYRTIETQKGWDFNGDLNLYRFDHMRVKFRLLELFLNVKKDITSQVYSCRI